ncbi:winged helix-turn-helix transcriptional regulator [Paenibacillus sp. GSMTC-2017]|uniref:winged helix-turn-helix domain-containing protein n=1 Tax=Paenibacillus sp. GSMTC-2017 TaxID=2794350 RepID=UPI0018D80CF3|nr:winged helix-turn-helix domain-containing protein [Paenibacillus sp. GSMTC-2017]MBH5320941.1 winged helix-turn-helix transcriptional regulator [Paenibacillus sp. GSMTC-2017]
MLELLFNTTNYTVTHGSDRQELLAKEFALLQFLFENRNRTFTRGQLLDHVWPLEYPVDRTVDDHIYRLRKKLKHWESIEIHTIRGYGYSLTIQEPKQFKNPSMNDNDMKETIVNLFKKYHRFGQGKSMIALATQQDVLGFELNPYYLMYIHFIQGDISWFIHSSDIPMQERFYWMLILHRLTTSDAVRTLDFCERALKTNLLSSEQHREMTVLNIMEVYADAGREIDAIKQFKHTRKTVNEQQLVGFIIPIEIMEVYVLLLAGQFSEVEKRLVGLEEMLQSSPYLREVGRYQIVKGLWLLSCGKREDAIILLDEGIEVLKMSLHTPQLVISIQQIIVYVEQHVQDAVLLNKFKTMFESLDKQYRLTTHKKELEHLIESTLLSV